MADEAMIKAKTAHKAAIVAAGPGAIWRLVRFATTQEAVDFANVPPVQKGGEFGMTDDPTGGGVAGYYFF
jgi:hypothetical protein